MHPQHPCVSCSFDSRWALPCFLPIAGKVWACLTSPASNTQSKNSPEETANPRGDSKKTGRYHVCFIVFDVHYRPVISESPLGFGVSSGESMDTVVFYEPQVTISHQRVMADLHLSVPSNGSKLRVLDPLSQIEVTETQHIEHCIYYDYYY